MLASESQATTGEKAEYKAIQNFARSLTAAEKEEYAAIKGLGSAARKKQFRDTIAAQRLKNHSAAVQSVSSSSEQDTTVGVYRNFWVIAEKEGGLMNRDFGIKVATSICSKCELKGPPALLWDPTAQCIKYLHCEVGKNEAQTRMRQSILSADIEMEAASIEAALKMGDAEGLQTAIPAGELGGLHNLCAQTGGAKAAASAIDNEPEGTGNDGVWGMLITVLISFLFLVIYFMWFGNNIFRISGDEEYV